MDLNLTFSSVIFSLVCEQFFFSLPHMHEVLAMNLQVMGLLEVVTSTAGAKPEVKAKAKATETRPVPATADATGVAVAGEAASSHTDTAPATASGDAQTVTSMLDSLRSTGDAEAPRPDASTAAVSVEEVDPSALASDQKLDATAVLLSLPEPELRNLCKLLAREGCVLQRSLHIFLEYYISSFLSFCQELVPHDF
jgi:hypothetical protein